MGGCKGQREPMVLQGVKGGLGEGKRGGLSTEAEPNSEAVPQGARVEAVSPLPQGIRRGPCGLWEPVGCGEPEESSGGVSLSQEESRPEGDPAPQVPTHCPSRIGTRPEAIM